MKLQARLLVLALLVLALFSMVDNKTMFNVNASNGLRLEGCWSPYPNCVGASDVFVDDSTGKAYECGSCDGKADHCYEVDLETLKKIGYWCS